MEINLSKREIAQILASLRFWQDSPHADVLAENDYEAYFEDIETLSSEEIDTFCAKTVDASFKAKFE